MSIAQVHQIAPITHHDGASTETVIPAITSVDFSAGTETIREVVPGSIYPELPRITSIKPTLTFTTLQLHSALTLFNITPYCLGAGETLRVYVAKRECGGIAAGSVHRRYDISGALVLPRTLRFDHQQNAEITYEAYPVTSDGITSAISVADNLALPADPVDLFSPEHRWEMNKVEVTADNYIATGKQSCSIDFGATASQISSDSEVYDSFVGVNNMVPTMNVSGLDFQWWEPGESTAATPEGKTSVQEDTIIFLKKVGTINATPEHMRFRGACTVIMDQLLSGSNNDDATNSFRMEFYDDGTNAPIETDIGFAIT